jgi:CheY-like chemotaxis protein
VSENLRPKVMLIEDDESMLSVLKTLLDFEGFQTIAVEKTQEINSVAEIIDMIRQERPGLLLLDVYFRKINGLDVLRCLRKDPVISDIRVLISSGMDLAGECEQEGADDFLLKPYMPDDLTRKIRELVGV